MTHEPECKFRTEPADTPCLCYSLSINYDRESKTMTHEPECVQFGQVQQTKPYTCLWCAKIRAGYQRGKADAVEPVTTMLQKHQEVCNYYAVNQETCDVCEWAKSMIQLIEAQR